MSPHYQICTSKENIINPNIGTYCSVKCSQKVRTFSLSLTHAEHSAIVE